MTPRHILDFDATEIVTTLAALGMRLFEIDADRNLTRLMPASPAMAGAVIGQDVRALVDPLAPINQHPEVARAVAAREPFRDLLIPISAGAGTRMMRVAGYPRFDDDGGYLGYRGIAVDAGLSRDPAEAAPPPAPRQRVLLVHELTDAADLIAISLERAGFETGVCRDPAEAVEILLERETVWDVVITTAAHATRDGVDLLRHAKSLNRQTLCIVCDRPEQVATLGSGADLCWSWPGSPAALTQLVKAETSRIVEPAGP